MGACRKKKAVNGGTKLLLEDCVAGLTK